MERNFRRGKKRQRKFYELHSQLGGTLGDEDQPQGSFGPKSQGGSGRSGGENTVNRWAN